MGRVLLLAYGLFAYGAFNCIILYMIGFVSGIIVPKNIDTGIPEAPAIAILIDSALLLLFGASHSIMARPGFKEWLTRFISPTAERSTFVMVANCALAVLFWQWRPLNSVVWASPPPIDSLLFGVSMVGWVFVFWSSFLIDHFDLFGLRQVWLKYHNLEYAPRPFVVRGLYKYVRHPLMLGFLIAFWFAPTMTFGHMLFSIGMTIYILIGIF